MSIRPPVSLFLYLPRVLSADEFIGVLSDVKAVAKIARKVSPETLVSYVPFEYVLGLMRDPIIRSLSMECVRLQVKKFAWTIGTSM